MNSGCPGRAQFDRVQKRTHVGARHYHDMNKKRVNFKRSLLQLCVPNICIAFVAARTAGGLRSIGAMMQRVIQQVTHNRI